MKRFLNLKPLSRLVVFPSLLYGLFASAEDEADKIKLTQKTGEILVLYRSNYLKGHAVASHMPPNCGPKSKVSVKKLSPGNYKIETSGEKCSSGPVTSLILSKQIEELDLFLESGTLKNTSDAFKAYLKLKAFVQKGIIRSKFIKVYPGSPSKGLSVTGEFFNKNGRIKANQKVESGLILDL